MDFRTTPYDLPQVEVLQRPAGTRETVHPSRELQSEPAALQSALHLRELLCPKQLGRRFEPWRSVGAFTPYPFYGYQLKERYICYEIHRKRSYSVVL